jgi:hypothetical protein
MPASFPCPNPACAHAFPAEAVRGADRLTCPRCNAVFQFRSAAALARAVAAPKPATPAKAAAKPPIAKPVAPATPRPIARPAIAPPVAKPVPPPLPPTAPRATPPPSAVSVVAVAVAVPVAEPNSSLIFGSKPDILLTPARRRGGPPAWVVLLIVLGVGSAVGGAVALMGLLRSPGASLPAAGAEMYAAQGNFRLKTPAAPWAVDNDLKGKLHVNVALRRSGPANAMAVFFRDYKDRLPSTAEMLDDALDKLRAAFSDLEYEAKPGDPEGKLSDKPALLVEFQGTDADRVLVDGEVVMLAERGLGYWFYTWGPAGERDVVRPEWAQLRQGFTLENRREGWTEKPPKLASAAGKLLPYKVEYAERVWDKIPPDDRDAYDKRAELVLLGHDPKDKEVQSAGMRATVQVLVLDKAADLGAADKAAREYLLEKLKEKQPSGEYNYPTTTMEVTTDKGLQRNADNDCDVGGFRGHLTKFDVKNSADRRQYVVLAVVRTEEGVLAAVGECAWARRDFWEQEFGPLLDKLRPAKGK